MAIGKTPFDIFREHAWRFVGQFALWFSVLVAGMALLGLVPDAFMGAVPGERWARQTFSDLVAWTTGGDRGNDRDDEDDIDLEAGIDEGVVLTVSADDITGIRADSVDIDVAVVHPTSTDVAVLDESLKRGAVYYPGSGTPASGNIFIFGHSTNWAVVQNQSYKAFNDLDKLEVGETIVLETAYANFVYRVDRVTLVDAEDALVSFESDVPKLTVSTCNTFGEKQERHVAEATLVATNLK